MVPTPGSVSETPEELGQDTESGAPNEGIRL